MILVLFLVGPIILGVKLLGASWLLASFIGLTAPVVILLLVAVVAFLLDERESRRRKKRAKKLREERGTTKR